MPQQRGGGWQKLVTGIGWALVSAYATFFLSQFPETAASLRSSAFFISASTLIMLLIGWSIPVTHHITLPAAYGVLMRS